VQAFATISSFLSLFGSCCIIGSLGKTYLDAEKKKKLSFQDEMVFVLSILDAASSIAFIFGRAPVSWTEVAFCFRNLFVRGWVMLN